MQTATGYRATRQGEKLIVHDVPIFAECFRKPRTGPDGSGPVFDGQFDQEWVTKAAATVMARHRDDGYFPPLHIYHHQQTANGDAARPAGTFKVTGTRVMRFEGRPRVAIVADLIVTDPDAQKDVLAGRLPFRSVEILNVDARPSIDSLALLDHEVPFLKLPNLDIADVQEGDVAGATVGEVWEMTKLQDGGPMVACADRGPTAALLFREDQHMNKTDDTTQAEPFAAGINFEDDKPKGDAPGEDKKKEDMADGEDAGMDIGALLKAIESREISVKDMDALEAAIIKSRAAAAGEDEPTEPENQPAAPAAMPGGEAMRASNDPQLTEQFAALKAESLDTKAKLAEMRAEVAREKEVAQALAKLNGRALGDIESELMQFHAEHGAKAFGSMVEKLVKHNPVAPTGDALSTDAPASELAMQFSEAGPEAVSKAMQFEREYDEMRASGLRTSCTREEFVKFSMDPV